LTEFDQIAIVRQSEVAHVTIQTVSPNQAMTMTSFEQQIQRLETIVKSLDRGDEPIAVLIELYGEGISLAGKCREYLETAEQRVTAIDQENG
jgi:exodeoxyribonuclease VII small subunit